MKTRIPTLIIALTIISAMPLNSQVNWIDITGGIYGDSSNWDPAGIPTGTDPILFNNPNNINGTYTVTFDQDREARNLQNQTGNPTFDLDGNTFTLSLTGSTAREALEFDGRHGGSTTTFSNGTINSYGRLTMGGGTVLNGRTVTFNNVTLNFLAGDELNRDILVGRYSAGSNTNGLSGHTLVFENSTVNARIMRSGLSGGIFDTTIDITSGSTVDLDGEITIGWTDATNNFVNVSGGSQVDTTDIIIANFAGANNNGLTISGQDTVVNISNNLEVRSFENSINISDQAEVNVASKMVMASSSSQTGHAVSITGGSQVSAGEIEIANTSNSSGNTFTMSGADTQLSSDWIQVGVTGASSNVFTMNDGTLNVGSDSAAGYFLVTGSGNSATFNSGNVTIQDTSGTGYLRATSGNSISIDGATLTVDQVRIANGENGFSFNSGTLNVDVFNPAVVTEAGNFTVGNGSGDTATLALTGLNEHRFGDLTLLADSIISFSISGTGIDEFAFADLSGELSYGGTLAIALSATPMAGQSFALFSGFTDQSGVFADFDLPELDPGLNWDFDHSTGVLSISVIPEPTTASYALGLGLIVFARCVMMRRKKN